MTIENTDPINTVTEKADSLAGHIKTLTALVNQHTLEIDYLKTQNELLADRVTALETPDTPE